MRTREHVKKNKSRLKTNSSFVYYLHHKWNKVFIFVLFLPQHLIYFGFFVAAILPQAQPGNHTAHIHFLILFLSLFVHQKYISVLRMLYPNIANQICLMPLNESGIQNSHNQPFQLQHSINTNSRESWCSWWWRFLWLMMWMTQTDSFDSTSPPPLPQSRSVFPLTARELDLDPRN